MWLPPWVETGGTPYWLTLSVGPGNAHRVATALASAYPDLPGPHVRDQQPGTVVAPLYCPPGAEPDRLVDALAGQVFRLAVHVADL